MNNVGKLDIGQRGISLECVKDANIIGIKQSLSHMKTTFCMNLA